MITHLGFVVSFCSALLCACSATPSVERVEVPAEVISILGAKLAESDAIFEGIRVDLNRDGSQELVVEGRGNYFCGAVGNCSTWIFEHVPSGYRLLLDAGSIQDLKVLPSATNGYLDVITSRHDSATGTAQAIYKFDGMRYRAAECSFVDYSVLDDNGDVRELKEPQITKAKCHD